uniref:Putative ovule protein n=1 Tax=Solanum chacoense TaxID=4108 RepID=A0A0V0HCY7_SOLCH
MCNFMVLGILNKKKRKLIGYLVGCFSILNRKGTTLEFDHLISYIVCEFWLIELVLYVLLVECLYWGIL